MNTRNNAVTWIVTIAACVYLAWTGIALFRATGILMNMFASMAVELPLSTRVLISGYYVVYPLVFGSAMAVVIAKQLFVRESWMNLAFTFGVIVLADIAARLFVMALYQPLFELIDKLK